MFTGIIQEVGKIIEVKENSKGKIFIIQTKELLADKKIGDSISTNGCCLTITNISGENFTCEAIEETLNLTNLSSLTTNSEVNLEGAMKIGDTLDGHMVQGHIDCTGEVLGWQKDTLKIKFPQEIAMYLAYKGSITINGVSLTISKLKDQDLEVSLIPHTIENTNLGKLKKNDKVNLEVDMIARYLESLLKQKNKEAKYEFLKERGFI
jgi:riboflavin synthase